MKGREGEAEEGEGCCSLSSCCLSPTHPPAALMPQPCSLFQGRRGLLDQAREGQEAQCWFHSPGLSPSSHDN